MKVTYKFQIYVLLCLGFLLGIKYVVQNQPIREGFGGTALILATRNAVEIKANRLRTLLLRRNVNLDQENIQINREDIDKNEKRIKLNRNNIEKNANNIEINSKDIEVNRHHIKVNKKNIAWNRKEIIKIKKILEEYVENNIEKLKKGTCDAEKNAFMMRDCMETPNTPECKSYKYSTYKCKAFRDVRL
jgi:hypothetical protein